MMSLTDLRAYFQVKKKPCNVEKFEPGPQMGWRCTLPVGHDGSHVAHDLDGTLIERWSA